MSSAGTNGTKDATSSGNSLYVGSLDPRVCTELLQDIFSLAGKVILCRVVADRQTNQSMRFGFVDYEDHATASKSLDMFNGRSIYGSPMTVDWAHAGAGAAAGRPASSADDMSNHYCLFIGNLSSDVTDDQLREAFSKYGTCSSAKVAKDPTSGKNQGYAFVSFRERQAAESAIAELDGVSLNNRPLRVDWAKTKTNAATRAAAMGLPDPPSVGGGASTGDRRRGGLSLEAIRGQTPAANITAYVAGLPPSVNEADLRDAFAQFGQIHEVRIPDSVKTQRGDKLYAFVRYVDHESAARAIFESQEGKIVAGRPVTVHWGREIVRRTPMMMHRAPPMRMGIGAGGGMGYAPPAYGQHAPQYGQPQYGQPAQYGQQYGQGYQQPPRSQFAPNAQNATPYGRGAPPGAMGQAPNAGPPHHHQRPY